MGCIESTRGYAALATSDGLALAFASLPEDMRVAIFARFDCAVVFFVLRRVSMEWRTLIDKNQPGVYCQACYNRKTLRNRKTCNTTCKSVCRRSMHNFLLLPNHHLTLWSAKNMHKFYCARWCGATMPDGTISRCSLWHNSWRHDCPCAGCVRWNSSTSMFFDPDADTSSDDNIIYNII